MFTFGRYRYLITLITIQTTSVSFAHSYEQGSYFVFNIIESSELETTKGSLVIPAEALAKTETQRTATEQTERSEFEIDFKQAIQPKTTDSAFKSDPSAKMEPFTRTTSFQEKALDFGSSDSVFGE